jgi:hypothetical protein
MLIYWTMFWVPLLAVISAKPMVRSQGRVMFVLVCFVFAIVMGLRHEVGGDWFSYLAYFQYIETLNLGWAAELKDPGYTLLNWIISWLGGDIHVVNLVCATIIMVGVMRFCRTSPNPWLALLVAVPYLLIVVGMGYTRQAVAIGFIMFGLVSLGNGRTLSFVICVLLGALFHSSSVLIIPIAGLASSRRRIWSALWVASSFLVAYVVLFREESDALWQNYVEAEMYSYGAIERVLMNVVAAVLLLVFHRRLLEESQNRRLWIIFSWLSLACLPVVFLASTAVDRMALYLLPLQLVVFSRLPNLTRDSTARTAIVLGIVVYYAAVQFVWLNFAREQHSWVPYHFVSFD